MVKSLSDVCLDFLCNEIGNFGDVSSSLTLQQQESILKRLAVHGKLTVDLLPVIKNQLLSTALQDVTLQGCKQVDNEFLDVLGVSCTGLKSLVIVNCCNVGDFGLKKVFQNVRNLKTLTLNVLPKVTGICFRSASCKNLSYADMQMNGSLEDTGIAELVQSCHIISYLNLSYCAKITDAGIEYIAGFLLGKLESLGCSGVTELTDVSLISLADRCYNLRELKLHGCTKVTQVGLRAIFKACPISATDLSYCYKISEEPDILSDCFSSSLSKLTLRGTQVNARFLEAVSLQCSNLQALKICGIHSVTDEVFCEILQNIGCNLKSLDLSWCSQLTDVTVKAIIAKCPKLAKLCMPYCSGITGEPLKIFASEDYQKQAKLICKLAFQGCRKFNTSVMCDILPYFVNLEYIGVSGQRLFADEEMFSLARNCSRLRSLCVKGCVQISDSGICEALRLCPKLDTLVLSGLHLLTDKSIFFMASSIPTSLRYLFISGCSKISHPAVTYLKDVCTNYLTVEQKIPNAAPDQLMAKNLDTGEFCRVDLMHLST